jgi:hypothetical protein
MSYWPRRVGNPSLLCAMAAAFSLLLTAMPAWGAGRQAKEKTARKACLAGDYSKGVPILADLFVETRDPVYIFNQGRCFEQNRRYEDAIARFEEYLRAGETMKLGPEDRAAAEKHIADCKGRLPDQSSKSQVSAPQPIVPPPPTPVAPAAPTSPEPSTSIVAPPPAATCAYE